VTKSQAQSYGRLTFDIARQDLALSLLEFGRQAELSVLVRKEDVKDLIAPPLSGRYYPWEALSVLLRDSSLGFRFIDQNTISVGPGLPRPVYKRDSAHPAPEEDLVPPQEIVGWVPAIDEVIVTSQRRTENMQTVPLAVSVIRPPYIRESRIYDLDDIGTRIPGLTVSSFSLGQPTIHMRGIGSGDDGAALDNSVAMFLDDVYVGRITAINLALFDVERVEVLRGPQGTLYGKNAIGGAINVITRNPSRQFEMVGEATIGNYDRRDFRAEIGGPLEGEKLLGKLSFHSRSREGWQESLFLPGEDQMDDNNLSLRAKLLYQPESDLRFDLIADYSRDDLGSTGRIPVVGRVPLRLLDETGQPTGEAALPTDIFAALGGSVRRAANDERGFTDRDMWGISSRASWQTDAGQLLSVTAYRKNSFAWAEDSVALPNDLTDQQVNSVVDEDHQQFSQEFRWLSPDDSPLLYVFGLYYLYEKTHRVETFVFPDRAAVTDQNNRTQSLASFGELSYRFARGWDLKLGARLTYEEKKMDQLALSGNAPAIIREDFQLTNKGDWTDFSPRLVLSWQADRDLMLYGSLSRGFKSGGFQGAPGTRELAERIIRPESAWNYELGIKSQWWEDRMRFNLVGFYTDYRDLQVVQFVTEGNFGVFRTSNAMSASLTGVELEVVLNLWHGLELSGSYAWLEAVYDEFTDVLGRDFSGNRLRQAPENSFDIGVYYERSLGEGRLRFRAEYRYQDESFREPDNRVTNQPAFDILDASVAYEQAEGDWEITLWAKNLLDEEYISHLYILGGNDYALFGEPRTYGVTFTYNFQ